MRLILCISMASRVKVVVDWEGGDTSVSCWMIFEDQTQKIDGRDPSTVFHVSRDVEKSPRLGPRDL